MVTEGINTKYSGGNLYNNLSNKNSPVLQHMLTILPSGSNALRYLWNAPLSVFLQRKLLKSRGRCCVVVIWECGDLSYTIYLLNFSTNVSHNLLLLRGTCPPGNWHQTFLRHFPADSYSKYFTPNAQAADWYVQLNACFYGTKWFTEKCITSSKCSSWCKSFRRQL